MRKVYDLYQSDQISREGFGKLYKPLEEQENGLATEQGRLQGEIDALEIHQLSADEIVSEATTLHQLWPKFTPEGKRNIVESIIDKIVVAGSEIDITFSYLPSSEELTKRQRTLYGQLRKVTEASSPLHSRQTNRVIPCNQPHPSPLSIIHCSLSTPSILL
jgi:hypothetical protein